MFSFFHTKQRPAGDLSGIGCDMHSHLIPGIDDGAQDLGSALTLIRGLVDLGYKKIITTPHINADFFPNTPDIINKGKALVEDELRRQQIRVEFRAAAEYLIDDHFILALANGEEFLTIKDKLILVELPFAVPAINLKEILFNLQLNGYQPVLAHPERYLYFGANKGWYDQLIDAGCLFQLNLLSFSGHYGAESQQLANFLVKKRYISFVGTDLHHARHLELIRNSPAVFRAVGKLADEGLINNGSL